MKKYLSILVNVGISVGAIGFLGWKASQDPQFLKLVEGPKNWSLMALASGLVLIAVVITFLRWRMLVQTLGLPLTIPSALRIGFLSYLFNLLPLGLVGGDGLKAFSISQLHPEDKTKAVATVLLDRVIGLAALLMFAAVATLLFNRTSITGDERAIVDRICLGTQIAGLISVLGLAMFFIPGFTSLSIWDKFAGLPVVGGIVKKLIEAMRLYRQRSDKILIAIGLSLIVHTLYVFMIYLVGGALLEGGKPTPRPNLGSHFVIGPLAMTAGALPLGGMELTLNPLYRTVLPADALASSSQNKGFLIVLLYRLIQILVAAIGVVYYLSSRRETQTMLQKAAETQPSG